MKTGLLLLFAPLWVAGALAQQPATPAAKAISNYGKLPLHFEPNRGQVDGSVRYLTRLPEMTVYMTDNEAVMSWRRSEGRRAKTESAVVRMKLSGAAKPKAIEGTSQLPGIQNYFLGSDPAKWRTNIPLYGKVRYEGIYPGVDAVFYGNRERLEWDFVVSPGSDPTQIALQLLGVTGLKISESGELAAKTALGILRLEKPVIYQQRAGKRHDVEGGYRLMADNRVAFRLGKYDQSLPLVIDPTLAYSTALGGAHCCTYAYNVAVNAAGNAFIAGQTSSDDFPKAGALQANLAGASDAFVTKLNPAGTALVYSTYLGGSNSDYAMGIDVDTAGNAYVAGQTGSANFPLQAPAQTTLKGWADVFLAKLNPAGNALVYSTYLGGSSYEYSGTNPLAVNKTNGDAYVIGETASGDFPVASAYQPSPGQSSDAFVAKYNTTGVKQFATYLGGPNFDSGQAIALDQSSNIYLTGYTYGDFPVTSGAFQTTYRGGERVPNPQTYPRGIGFRPSARAESPDLPGPLGGADLFVTKMLANGSGLLYSTYLGGTDWDAPTDIAVHSSGSAYVTGNTKSLDFPVTAGVVQHQQKGIPSGFVSRLNATGTALLYSTYLGGAKSDWPSGIAVEEPSGNAVITGSTYSGDFPVATAVQPVKGGAGAVVFVTANSGATWAKADGGMGAYSVNALAVRPGTPATVLAATNSQTYRSTNSGTTWTAVNGIANSNVVAYANASTAYAADNSDLYKSTDAGANWNWVSKIPGTTRVTQLVVHPTNASVLYAGKDGDGIFYSSNGGGTWEARNNGLGDLHIESLAVSRSNPSVLYTGTDGGLYKSTNSGTNWAVTNWVATNPASHAYSLSVHPSDPNTAYASDGCAYKTVDGGAHWSFLGMCNGMIAVAQSSASIVYTGGTGPLFRSNNGGSTWTAVNSGIYRVYGTSLVVAPSNAAKVYVGTFVSTSAFVTRLNATGKAYLSSTFLNGSSNSYGIGVAVTGTDAYVAGYTWADDFPTTTGAFDRTTFDKAFVAKITTASPACSFQPNPASRSFGNGGGVQTFSVVTSSNCSWAASSPKTWMHVVDGGTGAKGIRTVTITVDSNPGPARSTNLKVGTKLIPITQDAFN